MIKINRPCEYTDIFREYKIILDDEEIGKIKSGESKRFQVSQGKHTIYLKIGYCMSNKIKFYAIKDRCIEFDCGNSMEGWRTFMAFIYMTFLQNKYLWINRVYE